MKKRVLVLGAALFTSAAVLVSQEYQLPNIPDNVLKADPIVRAMRDELERSKQLGIVGGRDAPYFVSYTLTDADNLHVSSTLGAIVNVRRNEFRSPQVEVRVGSYESDQTNHVSTGAYSGARYDGTWPLDNNYENLRDGFWLATDRAFKAALESISRKRATQNNSAAPADPLPDFSKSPPVVKLGPVKPEPINEQAWVDRAKRYSSVFANYPEVLSSDIEVSIIDGTTYLLNTEGTAIHYDDGLAWLMSKAEGQAPDGMLVHDAATIQSLTASQFPADDEVRRELTATAENVRALAQAPAGEAYSGPALFEPRAAAQLLAQLLGDNLRVPRRPVTNAGQSVNMLSSEFETRMGSRILPDIFTVVDDPTQTTHNGRRLAGHYDFDLEGVPPQPVTVVENGILKSFLTTRQPVKGSTGSNGHARLPGSYGASGAAIGNLFVRTEESMPLADLKRQLIETAAQRGKDYGMIVRKLDYPFAGTTSELQAVAQASTQTGGSARPVSPPLLVYKVYADGREELVRGLRFQALTTRTLRDILAASQETAVFEFVNTASPLAFLGSGGLLAPASVVSPGLLFDEIEFGTPREQAPKPPTVPPPSRMPQ